MKFTIGQIDVRESAFGIELSIPFITEGKYTKYINISVREEGVNISATGTLSREGEEALADGLKLASIIRKYGMKRPTI